MAKLAILILAAGSASRMGKTKQLLPYGNTTLLEHAILQAKNSKANACFCVLGADATRIKDSITTPIKFIENTNWKDGLSSSIVSGIQHLKELQFDYVLIMLADQPNVDTAYLNELIEASVNERRHIIASGYGSKNGVPAVFPKEHFFELERLKGDLGARVLLNSKDQLLHIINAKNKLQDIDTPEDYAQLRKN